MGSIVTMKHRILDQALRGNLVEQNDLDESAYRLVEEIEKERDLLIKERILSKTKPLPEIEDKDVPYKIPDGWKWVRLGEVSKKIHYGYTASATDVDTGVRMVRITDIQNEKVNWKTIPFCEIEEGSISKYKLENNDIMIARTGGTVGKSFLVENVELTGVFASYLIRIQLFDKVSPKYVKRFLESVLYWKQITDSSKGTGQPNVNATDLGNLIIPLPPIHEQSRIIEKVEELFSICDEWEKEVEFQEKQIQTMREKLLQDALHGSLDNQNQNDEPATILLEKIQKKKELLIKEKKLKKSKPLPPIEQDEIPHDLPLGWIWVRVGDVAVINPRNALDDDLEVGFVPMKLIEDGYSGKHVSEARPWNEVKKGFTHFQENDIAIAKITPCFENKKSAIMKDLANGYGAGTTELHIVRPFHDYVLVDYLMYLFKSNSFIDKGVQTYTGTAGQQRIGKDFIQNYVVGLPPIEEQRRIVEKVNTVWETIDEIEGSIVKTK